MMKNLTKLLGMMMGFVLIVIAAVGGHYVHSETLTNPGGSFLVGLAGFVVFIVSYAPWND